jgi:superfamily II DNA or RNA helicase
MALDPRRTFTRRQVWRAWQLQDRKCKLCSRLIPFDLMHGDHIVPWSRGGTTTLDNMQALCGSCNLRKGSQPQEVVRAFFPPDRMAAGSGQLRPWQLEAVSVVLKAIGRESVLIEACPGAGKTHFGLEVAYRLAASGHLSRVLIVVPTIGIADGWAQAASASSPATPTLPLRTQRDWRSVDPIGEDWLGAILTYHSLFASTEMFLAHATDPGQRTLVIFDEIHHASAGAAWGLSAQEAFAAGSSAVLSLTGTPFRTDREDIVFVPSERGIARPHFTYGYREAIRDGACRPVQFAEVRGETTYRAENGKVEMVTFDEDVPTEGDMRRRLRTALEWIGDGSIAEKMLGDANDYLVSLRRRGDSDAAGLVVCVDCTHASKVADHMAARILGQRPVVACSRLFDENDPEPANAIRRFAVSHDPWLVAVNMVSEGIDIRRLRVVVYLTNRLTLLAFRQIIGRVVRIDPTNVDDHGRVYIPGDPRLVAMAQRVSADAELLPAPIVIEIDRTPVIHTGSTLAAARGEFEALRSVGEQGRVIDSEGREASAELVACARLFIEIEGLTGTDPESLALAALESDELRDALQSLRGRL